MQNTATVCVSSTYIHRDSEHLAFTLNGDPSFFLFFLFFQKLSEKLFHYLINDYMLLSSVARAAIQSSLFTDTLDSAMVMLGWESVKYTQH